MVDCFLKYAMIDFNYYCLRLQNEGNIMKNWADILKNLTILTQFGLSFITPLLLCLALSWWLTEKFRDRPLDLYSRLFLWTGRFRNGGL